MLKQIILKEGKEKSLVRRHPWIFSGAIESFPAIEPGEILSVLSSKGAFLAQAYFHPENTIAGRVLAFHEGNIEEELTLRVVEAELLRSQLFDRKTTNAYRLINAEADGLPGLIVDNYNGHLAIQISTYGMERLKPLIISILIKVIQPRSIYEKSLSPSRLQEGLKESHGLIYGEERDQIDIIENGIPFVVSIKLGQKTGFFLDQREMRQKIASLAKNKKVLNCFSYTGAFSIYALKGGATHVTSIDTCPQACAFAEQNTQLNGLTHHKVIREDVFAYLQREPLDFDLIILDPPAFTKRRKNLQAALNGYRQLNAMTLRKMPPRSILLTCSCSAHVDEELFQQTLFHAACEAQRSVRIIGRHIQASDHPVSLYHPEGSYLKSLLLFVE